MCVPQSRVVREELCRNFRSIIVCQEYWYISSRLTERDIVWLLFAASPDRLGIVMMSLRGNVEKNELLGLLALKTHRELLHLSQGYLKMFGPDSLLTEPCESQRSVTDILDLVPVHVA